MIQGCAFLDKAKVDPYESMSEAQLYQEGSIFLSNLDIPSALVVFQTLEARYPFSTYSQQSILDLAFAYYDFGQKDDAIAECDRFIDLYPNHPRVDYAYYLRALSNLEKDQPFFQEILGQDVSKYDLTRLRNAYNDFLFITNKFKGSKYAEDASNRLVFLRDKMARHETYVASYYLKRGAYVASSDRAKYMLEKYPGAPASEDALLILIQSYNKLNMYELAEESARVLVNNFKNYTYKKANDNQIIIKDTSITYTEKSDSWFDLELF